MNNCSLSPYFTDEQIMFNIRCCFTDDERWDMDLNTVFNQIEEVPIGWELRIKGLNIFIDAMTGVARIKENEV